MAANHAQPPTLGGGTSGGGEFTRREAADYIASFLESLRPIADAVALEEAKAEKGARRLAFSIHMFAQGHQLAAMALQPPGEVEFQQHDMDLADLDARHPDQLVDIDRARGERAHDPLALGLTDIG